MADLTCSVGCAVVVQAGTRQNAAISLEMSLETALGISLHRL
jgi:hypothetical protein